MADHGIQLLPFLIQPLPFLLKEVCISDEHASDLLLILGILFALGGIFAFHLAVKVELSQCVFDQYL